MKVEFQTKPNLTAMMYPWENGGWYAALVDDGYIQLVGPCMIPVNTRGLELMLNAIYDGTITISTVDDDGEEFCVLNPGGILHDRRYLSTKEAKKHWEDAFKKAKGIQDSRVVRHKESIRLIQERIKNG